LPLLRTRPPKNGTEDISQGKESCLSIDIAAPPELQPFAFVQVAKLMVSSRYSFVVREFLSLNTFRTILITQVNFISDNQKATVAAALRDNL
jgi:hypothetical protein